MHACLVSETYPPEINGVALTVQTLARGLRDLGHDVSLIRPRQPDHDVDVDADTEFGQLLVPSASLPRYPGLRFGFPVLRRIRCRWRQRRPDAVYVATEGPLGWAALRSARKLGIPVATGFHTRFDDYCGHYGLRMLTPLVFAWLRRFHNHAQATLVPTRELRDQLVSQGIGNVRLHRRTVDTMLFRHDRRCPALRHEWGLCDDQLAVILVGRIAPEKNLDLAVRAFRELRKQRPDARFIWVGDGPDRARLALENPDFVFAGIRRGEDLARHYASADLFLFPSLSETFGNVTLEAMASGVATVAFDYGAAREYIIDASLGRTVARDDSDGFIAAARELALDDGLRRSIGASAAQALAALQAGSVAEGFAELLDSLIRHKAA